MTNHLVGDVYAKIIEEVIAASTTDFEESGVGSTTLQELQQEWQAKLSARGVAQMPWDPKPAPVPQPPAAAPATPANAPNGMPPGNYPQYDQSQTAAANGAPRIKPEPGTEQQYHGLPTGAYPQNGVPPTQGGLARAQQLVQQQYGNAMPRGGLALPGQQARPQGLQLPAGNHLPQGSLAQQQFQQQQAHAMQRQQQVLQQQQQAQPPAAAPTPAQPRIKVENDQTNYSQTDGAGDDLQQWRAMLAERRAATAEQVQHADNMMHEQISKMSEEFKNGLMLPLSQQSSVRNKKRRAHKGTSGKASATLRSSYMPSIPQMDGEDDDEDGKAVKDEDDENAINSDLDDSDEDAQGNMGDDDEDEGDAILCTYDKVQRVKNKWKCTLKDGVMIVDGKDWVFHKGQGEFEW